jgi:DNA-binding transcriptional LysR family regulator
LRRTNTIVEDLAYGAPQRHYPPGVRAPQLTRQGRLLPRRTHFFVNAGKSFYVEPLFTRDPAATTETQILTAMLAIKGLYIPYGVRRPNHGICFNEAGHTLLRHTRATLGARQRMTDYLAQFSLGIRGTIRILSNTNALAETLPGPLSRFLCGNPNININIEIEQRPSDEIIAAIAEGVADIGIIASPPEGVALTLPFATDRLSAVVPAVDERIALQREIAFADLIEADFVGHERGSSIQMFLENQAKRLQRTLRHRIQLGNFESICRLVENGVGVAVFPESAARRFQRSMRVPLLRITDAWAVRKILICVSDLERLPSSTRRLVEHVARLDAAFG